jgi:hypothetical protein
MQPPPPPEPPPRPLPPQPLPWGYEPPQPPEPPRPWYRHPLGVFAIITGALLVVGLLANALNGGGGQAPAPATAPPAPGATAPPAPGATAPPATAAATTTTAPAALADRIRQAAQGELAAVGTVTAVDAEPGGQVTVTWDIAEAATMGLTRNQARLGALRIMNAVKQVEAGAGDDYQGVRLQGRFRLPGAAAPATVVRLRFSKATVQRTEFSEFRYLEAYDLADAAVIHPAFRG